MATFVCKYCGRQFEHDGIGSMFCCYCGMRQNTEYVAPSAPEAVRGKSSVRSRRRAVYSL